jgi:hypothetical protein
MEQEQFEQSDQEYSLCVRLLGDMEPCSQRRIAEAHYKHACALQVRAARRCTLLSPARTLTARPLAWPMQPPPQPGAGWQLPEALPGGARTWQPAPRAASHRAAQQCC